MNTTNQTIIANVFSHNNNNGSDGCLATDLNGTCSLNVTESAPSIQGSGSNSSVTQHSEQTLEHGHLANVTHSLNGTLTESAPSIQGSGSNSSVTQHSEQTSGHVAGAAGTAVAVLAAFICYKLLRKNNSKKSDLLVSNAEPELVSNGAAELVSNDEPESSAGQESDKFFIIKCISKFFLMFSRKNNSNAPATPAEEVKEEVKPAEVENPEAPAEEVKEEVKPAEVENPEAPAAPAAVKPAEEVKTAASATTEVPAAPAAVKPAEEVKPEAPAQGKKRFAFYAYGFSGVAVTALLIYYRSNVLNAMIAVMQPIVALVLAHKLLCASGLVAAVVSACYLYNNYWKENKNKEEAMPASTAAKI